FAFLLSRESGLAAASARSHGGCRTATILLLRGSAAAFLLFRAAATLRLRRRLHGFHLLRTRWNEFLSHHSLLRGERNAAPSTRKTEVTGKRRKKNEFLPAAGPGHEFVKDYRNRFSPLSRQEALKHVLY